MLRWEACCAGHFTSAYESPVSMALAQPKVYLPNWAIGGLLLGFVAGTYVYTMRAVGTDDLNVELTKELQRQERLAQEQQK